MLAAGIVNGNTSGSFEDSNRAPHKRKRSSAGVAEAAAVAEAGAVAEAAAVAEVDVVDGEQNDVAEPGVKVRRKSKGGKNIPVANVVSGEVFGEELFSALPTLDSALRKQLEYCQYKTATKIQQSSVKYLLDGKFDGLVKSVTGSGKTLAFLLPILDQMIVRNRVSPIVRSDGTRCLIVSPTRELAQQTYDVAYKLSQPFPWLICGDLLGGSSRKSEKARIRKGMILIIATPGRLVDHIETTLSFNVKNLIGFIVDEGDRILDLGFEGKLKTIVTFLRQRYSSETEAVLRVLDGDTSNKNSKADEAAFQTIFASATLSMKVKKLAEFCLRPAKTIWLANTSEDDGDGDVGGDGDEQHTMYDMPESLSQEVVVMENPKNRMMVLICKLLQIQQRQQKAILFVSSCDMVEYLHAMCEDLVWPENLNSVDTKERSKRSVAVEVRKSHLQYQQVTNKMQRQARHVDDDIDDLDDDGDDHLELLERAALQFSSAKVFGTTRFYKLHGNNGKEDRAGNLADFAKSSRSQVLIATDIAARGLNLQHVDVVLQFDAPLTVEDYVHRAGRTGRTGAAGHSVLLLLKHEAVTYVKYLRDLGLDKASSSGGRRRMKLVSDTHVLKSLAANAQTNSEGRTGLIHQHRASELGAAEDGRFAPLLPAFLEKMNLREPADFLRARFTKLVAATPAVAALARKAYLAFYKGYRAYPVLPEPYGRVFDHTAIHWGHVAGGLLCDASPRDVSRNEKNEPTAAIVRRTASAAQKPGRSSRPGSSLHKSSIHKSPLHRPTVSGRHGRGPPRPSVTSGANTSDLGDGVLSAKTVRKGPTKRLDRKDRPLKHRHVSDTDISKYI